MVKTDTDSTDFTSLQSIFLVSVLQMMPHQLWIIDDPAVLYIGEINLYLLILRVVCKHSDCWEALVAFCYIDTLAPV